MFSEQEFDSLQCLLEELRGVMTSVNEKSIMVLETKKRTRKLKKLIKDENQKLKDLEERTEMSAKIKQEKNVEEVTEPEVYFENEDADIVENGVSDKESAQGKRRSEAESFDEEWIPDEEIKSNDKNYERDKLQFTCQECGQSFIVNEKLKSHIIAHIVDITNICEICGLSFSLERSLKDHSQNHQADAEISPNKQKNSENGRIREGEKLFCNMCPRYFIVKKYLEIHKSEVHDEKNEDIAENCSDIFLSRNIQENPKSHSKNECQLHCSICGIDFPDKTDLADHAIDHLVERPCYCIICEKTFKHSSTLVAHIHLHSGEKPYKCSNCKVSFRLKTELSLHRSKIHNPSGWHPNKCYICSINCDTKAQLKLHHNISHSDEKPFGCLVCHRPFASNSDLKKHITIHTDEKKYQCDTCGRQFRSGRPLRSHLRIHSGEKPFSCEECGKCFRRYNILKNHKKTHQDVRAYQCDICSKLFKVQPSFIRHMKIHTGIKDFECDVCYKTFNMKGSLVTHYRIHTHEKPFKCTVCEKAFTQKGNLSKHNRIHIRDKP